MAQLSYAFRFVHVLPSILSALESRWLFRSASRGQREETFFAEEMNLFTNSMEPVIFALMVLAFSEHSAVGNIWHFERVTTSHTSFHVFVTPEAGLLACGCERAIRVLHLEAFIAAEDNHVPSFESINGAIESNF